MLTTQNDDDNITLDIDIEYSKFMRSNHFTFIKGYCKANKFGLYVRKSCRKNVHLKIIPRFKLPLLTKFEIRALLGDDKYRLIIDLVRHYKGMELNRLWDTKFKKGKLYHAGRWHKVI